MTDRCTCTSRQSEHDSHAIGCPVTQAAVLGLTEPPDHGDGRDHADDCMCPWCIAHYREAFNDA